MPAIDHKQLVAALLPAVLTAGAIEMRHYCEGCAVESKADASPVTAADREAEAVLVAAIAAAAPGIPIVAEEEVAAGRMPTLGSEFFLVDPLDGTREFIAQRGEFTVNIALVRDGAAVFGIVYAPACDELYVTLAPDVAAMARVTPREGPVTLDEIGLTPIHTRAPDPKALVALVSRSHATPETEALLARFAIASRTNAGSSLKFCAIARGAADIYPRIGPTMAWDTAAGHAVLAAAGGSVTTLDGKPLRYGDSMATLCNPNFIAWATPQPLAPRI
ncbi:MAG: 3'(2'),5'-bisphosphate nucleotidase [Hyphomicrobium sp. SCN 65-11]|nr:MAG: 3'(2'),5'-bisphosphate nucleotidase [Hyphomicrobium sp. SCN 65-11]